MATLYEDAELENIILQCPDENTYPDPITMIGSDGKRLYAYVTLVMLGDLYIAGAIVLAHTLRLLNTQADLVVLVTNDVSEEGRKILSSFFDKVHIINYVDITNWRTKKQKHKKYLEVVFTKFHLFDLTEYKKVLLIDADALVLKYPDHLFTLNTPAGCFLEDKDLFISYDKDGNYILPPDGKIKWYQKYCACCSHGKLIPKNMTDRVAYDQKNSGIGGGLMLLEPKKGEYDSIISDVSRGKMKYLVENKFVWPEQQYLTLRYSGKWHSINPRFFGLQGYPHWSVLYGLQYGGDKPFVLNSKFDMSIRVNYPDFVLFHKYYGQILKEHPEFSKSPVLKECNEMHKYFSIPVKSLSRTLHGYFERHHPIEKNHIFNFTNLPNPYDIQKLFMFNKLPIDNNLKYYFTDGHICYHQAELTPMFPNIKSYHYFSPIRKLSKHFNSSYYLNLYNDIKKYEYKSVSLNDLVDNNYDQNKLDDIILQYIMCRPTSRVIVFMKSIEKIKTVINELKKSGNIYYTRHIHLSPTGIKNLLFWVFDEYSFYDRQKLIKNNLKNNNYNDKITLIVFDPHPQKEGDINLNGFATYLHNFVNGLNGENNFTYVSNNFYQTVNCCKLLLNNNSISMLENQTILLNDAMNQVQLINHYKLQTLIKWLYSNMSLLEMSKLILLNSFDIISSTNDFGTIDVLYVDPANAEMEQLLYDKFENDETRIGIANMNVQNSKFWKKPVDIGEKLLDFLKINIDDILTNPTYYFYYQGIKLCAPNVEIPRRLLNGSPSDYADLVVMLLLCPVYANEYITISDKNKFIIKNNKLNNINPDITREFIQKIYDVINKNYKSLELKNEKSLMNFFTK